MDILKVLTKKNLKLNKKRTIVTIVGIMLSVALITSVAGVYTSGVASIRNMEIDHEGDYHYYFPTVTEDLDKFEHNKKIDDIGYIDNVGFAKIDNIVNEYKPYIDIMGVDKTAMSMMPVHIVEGRLPENDNEIIISKHTNTNGEANIKVGDTLNLEVGKRSFESCEFSDEEEKVEYVENADKYSKMPYQDGEELVDTKSKQYKVVGIMERFSYNLEDFDAPGYTALTYMDKKSISEDTSNSTGVLIRFTKKGIKDKYSVLSKLTGIKEETLRKFEENEYTSDEEFQKIDEEIQNADNQYSSNYYLVSIDTNPLMLSDMKAIVIIALVVCGIIVFASVFCITNSFDISITEKIKQYGMMRSVGATKKQIRKNVFYEAKILAAIGIPLGLILGNLATFILMMISDFLVNFGVKVELKFIYRFSVVAMVFAVILGIITIFLSSLKSAYKASKTSPLVLIRNSGDIKIKAKKLKVPGFVSKFFGIGGEISYKNLKRNKKKYRTTVIAIVISVTIFITLNYIVTELYKEAESEIVTRKYNITTSIEYSNVNEYREALKVGDFDNAGDYTAVQVGSLEEVKDIEYTEDYVEYWDQQPNEMIYADIICIGEKAYKDYVKKLGLKYEEVKDEVIWVDGCYTYDYNFEKQESEKKYVRKFDLKKGDTLSGGVFKYKENEDLKELEKRYDEAQTEEDFEEIRREHYVYVDFRIAEVTKERPLGLDDNMYEAFGIVSNEAYEKYIRNNYDGYSINYSFDSPDPDGLEKDIMNLYNIKDKDDSEKVRITNYAESVKQMKSILLLVSIFLYGFIIVIALIGMTNIFNTITTNMQLRQPEFAMLKSVGMTKGEFKRMIRLESVFMGVKALVYGIVLGTLGAFGTYKLFEIDNSGAKFCIPYGGIVISIIAVILIIWSIMAYSVSKNSKQNIIETIRNENI